jgi:hypothetical protein
MAQLPVPYETLLLQIAAAYELRDRLLAEPQTPKVESALKRLGEAQSRMLRALAQAEGTGAPNN